MPRSYILQSSLLESLFYLILFPQHWKFVGIDGGFNNLHFQVFYAEVKIPKPEDHTEKKQSI